MKQIIDPVSRELIIQELTEDRFLRETNRTNNEIYIVNHHNAPNTVREIGRLREVTFRDAGGGTGKEIDIDAYDTAEVPYEQLIIWDPSQHEIIGGYRYINCNNVPRDENGDIKLATSRLFNITDKFKTDYLPYLIELGRSFIQPKYQSTKAGSKAIFALDNLWDGLGALMIREPNLKYFFGKVTMYKSYNTEARDMILSFLNHFFSDPDNLITPLEPLDLGAQYHKVEKMFDGMEYPVAYKHLSAEVRKKGENIPPLVNAYMGLSPSMKTFGTISNDHFGGVEETAILITLKDIYSKKVQRHLVSYIDEMALKGKDIKIKLQ